MWNGKTIRWRYHLLCWNGKRIIGTTSAISIDNHGCIQRPNENPCSWKNCSYSKFHQTFSGGGITWSVRKGICINFAKFTGKHLCQSLFLNKIAGLRPATSTLLKKRLWHGYFPVNFAKFLRIPFLTEQVSA